MRGGPYNFPPFFCSGAISWRVPLAASEAALRIPLPRVKARGMPNAPTLLEGTACQRMTEHRQE